MIRLVLPLLACALLATACGKEETKAVGGEEQSRQTEAQTEAFYIPVAGLKYQVQISRVLNPFDAEDREYMEGIDQAEAETPGEGEVWFGVFMRVENDSPDPHMATNEFELVDTEERRYRPVELPAGENPVAYEAFELDPGQVLPFPKTLVGQGTIKGALVLFKIEAQALQNRPLELHFGGDVGEPGVIDLDV